MTAKYVVACCFAFAWVGVLTFGQSRTPAPVVSRDTLSEEQMAVYRAVLAASTDEHVRQVNLAARTVLIEASGPSSDEQCRKGMDVEPASAVVHHFKAADFAQLGKVKVRLVEPEHGRRDQGGNNPGRGIREGAPVDDALMSGYTQGLVVLSEIRFDKKHEHAIVSYRFECGELCGHGETFIFNKTKTGWKKSGGCSTWIS